MTALEYSAYLTGWEDQRTGEPSSKCPFPRRDGEGVLRARWYDGWYDSFFWNKYHDVIWRKRTKK